MKVTEQIKCKRCSKVVMLTFSSSRPRRYCSQDCSKHSGGMRSAEERFAEKIVKQNNGCWVWTGWKDKKGYGAFSGGKGRLQRVHRWSYEQKFGQIPAGLFACHKCDNPACANPDHIFLGTHTDNMRDAAKKGRLSKSHCKYGHPYSGTNLEFQRGFKVCRICRLRNNRESKIRRREKTRALSAKERG